MMRRTIALCAVVLLALLLAAPGVGVASAPYHERIPVSVTEVIPAGEVCDFDLQMEFEIVFNYIAWGDPVTREFLQGPYTAIDTNLSNGRTLVDTGSYVDIYDWEAQTYMEVGLTWHLRDPETGRLVLVTAGWAMFDWDGNVLALTPNQGTGMSMICEYLRGNPA